MMIYEVLVSDNYSSLAQYGGLWFRDLFLFIIFVREFHLSIHIQLKLAVHTIFMWRDINYVFQKIKSGVLIFLTCLDIG
jgi:hypothetical protein